MRGMDLENRMVEVGGGGDVTHRASTSCLAV